MEIIFVLIGISMVIAIGFLSSFFWAVKDGQFDDDYSPAVRMLFDDELINKPKTNDDKEKN